MNAKRMLASILITTALAFGQPAGIQEAAAKNREALSHYTWQEVQTLSVEGEVKKQTTSRVQLGPDGRPVKTVISEQDAPQKEPRGPLRRRIYQRKVDDFRDYVKQVVDLAHQYGHPDPAKMKDAFQKANVEEGDTPGQYTFRNYLKEGDSMTIVVNPQQKTLQSLKVSSYLDNDKNNKVEMTAQFENLPDGTNHVATTTITGQDRQLSVLVQNGNYQRK